MKITRDEEFNITGGEKIPAIEKGIKLIGLNPENNLNVLDVGGTRHTFLVLSRLFPKCSITSLNISNESLKGCKDPVRGDAQNFRLKKQFDVVIATDLIEHIVSTDAFFECAIKHLKQGGTLILTTPNLACWYNRAFLLMGYSLANYSASSRYRLGNPFLRPHPNEHKSVFNFGGLRDLLKRYGFEVIYSAGYTYGTQHSEKVSREGKFYGVRKIFDLILPMSLKEGMLLIAKKESPRITKTF